MELLQRPLKSHSDLASPKQPETHRASMPERLSPGPPLLSLPQEQRVLSSKQVLRGGRRGRTRSPDPPKPRPTPVQHIFQKPSLSQEEEGICCLLIQEADKPGASLQQQLEAQKAQDLLLDAHRPYIAREARRFQARIVGGKQASLDDLLLAGVSGLIQAAKRFQPPKQQQQQQQQQHELRQRPAKFLSYAHAYIQKSMRDACNGINDVYVPRYLTDMRLRIQQALAELEVEGKATTRQRSSEVPPPISMRAIAARAGVAPKAVRDYIHMAGLSFVGSGAGTDDESGDFADMAYNLGTRNLLGNEDEDENDSSLAVYSGTEALADQEVKGNALQGTLARVLNQNELEVLWRTMGLEENGSSGGKQSKRQIADELGISHQRVSQIYFKALEKLQKACSADPAFSSQVAELCNLPS